MLTYLNLPVYQDGLCKHIYYDCSGTSCPSPVTAMHELCFPLTPTFSVVAVFFLCRSFGKGIGSSVRSSYGVRCNRCSSRCSVTRSHNSRSCATTAKHSLTSLQRKTRELRWVILSIKTTQEIYGLNGRSL